jgi:hypothetical protein
MADNITLNPGAAGDVVAADDIGGVKHQRVKVEFGADGSATDVSSANPLPIFDGRRLSQSFGRDHINANIITQTASALVYTVTNDKIFFLTGLIISMVNTDDSNDGILLIKDGTTDAGNTIIPLNTGLATASNNAQLFLNMSFSTEPIPFSTGIFADLTSGTVTLSMTIVGYEEDI